MKPRNFKSLASIGLVLFALFFSSCKIILKIFDINPPTPENLEAEYIDQNGLAEISWDKVNVADEYKVSILEDGTNNIVIDTVVNNPASPGQILVQLSLNPDNYDVEVRSVIKDDKGDLESPPASTQLKYNIIIIEDVVVMKPAAPNSFGPEDCGCPSNGLASMPFESMSSGTRKQVAENLTNSQREIWFFNISKGTNSLTLKLGIGGAGCETWLVEKCAGGATLSYCDENENIVTGNGGKRLKIEFSAASGEVCYLKSLMNVSTNEMYLEIYDGDNSTVQASIEKYKCPQVENGVSCP